MTIKEPINKKTKKCNRKKVMKKQTRKEVKYEHIHKPTWTFRRGNELYKRVLRTFKD